LFITLDLPQLPHLF